MARRGVTPRQAVRPRRWRDTNMTMHVGTEGSPGEGVVDNVEQDHNGYASQISAGISAGVHDDAREATIRV